MAIAPTERLACPSNVGVHVPPLLEDFHTPPSAPPAQSVPLACTASAVMRPVTRPEPPPELLKTGSRYADESESYGLLVISDQVPRVVASAAACWRAAVN